MFANKKALTKMQAAATVAIIAVAAVAVIWYLTLPPPVPTELPEIVVGFPIPLTGAYSGIGEMMNYIRQIWEEDVAAKGGIYVKEYEAKLRVRTVTYDYESDIKKAAETAEKCIADGAIALIGSFGSSHVLSASVAAETHHIPYIVTAASSALHDGSREYLWCTYHRADYWFLGFSNWLKNYKAELDPEPQTVAILYVDNPWGIDIATSFDKLVEEYGFKVILKEPFSFGTEDFVPTLQRLKMLGDIDIFFQCGYSNNNLNILLQCKEVDLNAKLFVWSMGGTDPFVKEALGKDADYVIDCSFCAGEKMSWPRQKEIVERYTKMAGYNPGEALYYSYLEVLEAAIDKAGSIDPEKINNAIESFNTPENSILTCIGPVWFNEEHWCPRAPPIYQLQNGKAELIWPHESMCKGITYSHQWAYAWYPTPNWKERS